MNAPTQGTVYPVLPLRDIVVFPGMIVPLFVGREKSVKALEEVMKDDKQILLIAQKNATQDDPGPQDIYSIGTLGTVLQLLKLPDDTVKVLVEGGKRVRIAGYTDKTEFFEARAVEMEEVTGEAAELQAAARTVVSEFENYVKLNKKISPEVVGVVHCAGHGRRPDGDPGPVPAEGARVSRRGSGIAMEEARMTRDEIGERVADALVQALGVSRSEITEQTSLIGDLEAESIDFLDIVFRLEKGFGIEVARGELFPQELLRDPAFVDNGRLTAAGVAALRERFGFTDLCALQPGASVDDLMGELLTVNLIVDYVESKLPAHAAVQQV